MAGAKAQVLKGLFVILFNSYIFILFFLPVTLLGYFGLNRFGKFKMAQVWLVGMSLWFYGYFNWSYLAIICASVVINYYISRTLSGKVRIGKNIRNKKIFLIIGIVLNIGSIFWFKYYDFFISNVNVLFGQDFALKNLLLPLGISFFTFQQVSFLIDSYRGETGDYGFVEYALFVTYFPQLIAGPIVLHSEMIPQFRDEAKKRFDEDNFAKGIFIFAIGLFKKVLIADTFGKAVTWGFETVWDLTSLEVLWVSLAYTFQLYFDFSGYCDMAIGIGHMFNIDLPANFNSPYKATSIIDFWSRWHMSLTRFLRQYVYFPLGGSRKGKVRTYINVMIVFLVSGLWHGANWTFVVWGALHGLVQCINRAIRPIWDKVWFGVRWILTFGFVNCMWILFRADTVEKGFRFIGKLFVHDSDAQKVRLELFQSFDVIEFEFLEKHIGFLGNFVADKPWLHMVIFMVLAFSIIIFGKNSKEIKFKTNVATAVFAVILLVWSIMSLSGISTFLYFNF